MTIPFWTSSGTIDLANLRPQDLTPGTLADALAKVNRFGGRTTEPWPVAAHSVLVERLCPHELRPWGLLHDAHEAFIGDMTPPAVDLICRAGKRSAVEHAIANAKGQIDRAIGRAWGVTVRSLNHSLRQADHAALQAEAAVFLGVRPEVTTRAEADLFDDAVSFLMRMLQATDWRVARLLWLKRVDHYTGLGLLSPPKAFDPVGMVPADQPQKGT